MQDFLKDHGEWLVGGLAWFGTVLLGAFGLGKMKEKVTVMEEDIDELKQVNDDKAKICPSLMTIKSCAIRQDDCKKYQVLNHTYMMEKLDAFQLSQADANKVHTEQYSSIMKILANRGSE